MSVLLPVYNGTRYLRQAVESVLSQSYAQFEVVAIDDGSSDASWEIIGTFHDPRMRVYRQENRGLAATLNRAIEAAWGEYVARQDQDDLSLPSRLEKQVAYLESHPTCGMVGTWAEIWSGDTRTERQHRHAAENGLLQFDLLFDNPFVHSSVMVRKSVFGTVGPYSTDKTRQPPEDYELWSRVARQFEVANIPELLLVYREVPSSMSREGPSPFRDRVINISIENLQWAMGGTHAPAHVADLAALTHGAYDRVSPAPSLKGISRVLFEAADRVSERYQMPPGVLRARAEARLNDIRHHYEQCRLARGESAGGLKMWARALKRVAREGRARFSR